jgi:hypothetical protein
MELFIDFIYLFSVTTNYIKHNRCNFPKRRVDDADNE